MPRFAAISPSQQRRTIAVLLAVIAMLVGAFVGAWVFYAGLAIFALIAGADLAIYLLAVRSGRHRFRGHS
jgi:membrane protein YdbS with pleckstrin-like domain